MNDRLNFRTILKPQNRLALYLIAGMFLAVGCLLLFGDLAEDMLDRETEWFDLTVMVVVTLIRSPLVTKIMRVITALGSAPVITLFTIIFMGILLVRKHNGDAAMLIITLTGSSFLNWVLKQTFHRSRPQLGLVPAAGYSFPSGHAMVSFVFYGVLIYLLWVNFGRAWPSYLASFFLPILILAIGTSRIYLGVHYPTDVLAGYAAGGFWLTGCIMGVHSIRHYEDKRKQPDQII